MWKTVLTVFGPIIAVIGITAALRPSPNEASADEADATEVAPRLRINGVPAVPAVPAVPELNIDLSGLEVGEDEAGSADFVVNGVDEELRHECEDGETVLVRGAKNRIELEGECESVLITGAKNHVKAITVREITVSGVKNSMRVESTAGVTVTGTKNSLRYKNGMDGAEPTIVRRGLKHRVRRD